MTPAISPHTGADMAKPKSEEPESRVAEKVVSKKVLIALIGEGLSVASKNAENSGKHGEHVASSVENDGLDRKAFGVAKAAIRLGKNKGADAAIKMMRNAMLYFEMAVEGKMLGDIHVSDLFPDKPAEAEEKAEVVDEFDAADPEKMAAEASAKALERGIKQKASAPPPPPPANKDDAGADLPPHLRPGFQPTAH